MGLTKLAIRRPLTMLMIILALIILGINGFNSLKVDRYPEINFPYVATIVIYPGASPTDIETEIVKPVEDAVAGVSGLDYIQSTAREGVGIVLAAFKTNVDGDQAAIDVERALSNTDLPSDAQKPTIYKADIGAMPIMNIVLSGPQTLSEKYRLAEDIVKPKLLSKEGVAAVTISGGLEEEIQVQADPLKMAGHNVSLTQLAGVLMQENVDVPAGSVTTGTERTAIRSLGRFSSIAEIENVVVSSGNTRVYLKDVADVRDTHKEIEERLRLDGEDTVSLSVTKQSDANTVQTSENIRKAIEELHAAVPAGMSIDIVNDDSQYTEAAVHAVEFDLVLAVLITGAVLLFFLHMWRSTIIVLLAVPTSLISTFLVMFLLGFSLNQVSLMALALVIGVLVDDSVVVLENIVRHLGMGKSPDQAALDGRAEIGMAAMVITFCDVVIYLPVAFMSGIIGQFFKEYGITIAVAVLFSLFMSFTLTPMLAASWLKGETKPRGLWGAFVNTWERGYGALVNFYGRLLHWSLHHRPVVVVVAILSLVAAFAMIPLGLLPTEFMPAEDTSKVSINIQMPAGTDLETTDKVVRQIEDIAMAYPETKNVLAQVGSQGSNIFSQLGSSGASITVNLVGKNERSRSSAQVAEALRSDVAFLPDANIMVSVPASLGGGDEADLELMIAGPDIDTLIELANQVEQVMLNTPGIAGVRNIQAQRSPELQMILDRDRMKDLGLSSSAVGQALRMAVAGSQVSTFRVEGQPELDLTLIANERTRGDIEQLGRLPLTYTSNNTPVRVSQVAQLADADAPSVITRYNRERTITISANLAQGAALGEVNTAVMKGIEENVSFPEGYRIPESGMIEIMNESFASLFQALFLSIILIYMLMVALYESLVSPFAIMFSLPVSLVGAFLGLALTGNTLNIFSMLGLIMLMGLVTKNGILIVDFADILRQQGVSRTEALIQAGKQRMRPILMTSAAIIFAMIPLVLKLEAGAESRAPLAAVVIGGMLTSTLLSLVVIPTAYSYLDGLETFVRVKILRGRPRFAPKPAGEERTPPATPAGQTAHSSSEA